MFLTNKTCLLLAVIFIQQPFMVSAADCYGDIGVHPDLCLFTTSLRRIAKRLILQRSCPGYSSRYLRQLVLWQRRDRMHPYWADPQQRCHCWISKSYYSRSIQLLHWCYSEHHRFVLQQCSKNLQGHRCRFIRRVVPRWSILPYWACNQRRVYLELTAPSWSWCLGPWRTIIRQRRHRSVYLWAAALLCWAWTRGGTGLFRHQWGMFRCRAEGQYSASTNLWVGWIQTFVKTLDCLLCNSNHSFRWRVHHRGLFWVWIDKIRMREIYDTQLGTVWKLKWNITAHDLDNEEQSSSVLVLFILMRDFGDD